MFWPLRNLSMACPPPARFHREARWAILVAAILLSATMGAAQEKASAPTPTPPSGPPAKAEFIGSEACQACHEDTFNSFKKNPHHQVETDKKRGFENNACESCHGPGSKHMESMSAADIRNPAKLKPADADKLCLTCHLNQPTHIGRLTGSHAKNQVSCVACHAVHKNGPDGLVARKPVDINKLCAGCHVDVAASFKRPFGHKLTSGGMSCVDCHNPHGTFQPKSLQSFRSNEPGCLNCHGDKSGPFLHEHAPMKTDGCMACHQPHGSSNPRLLTRQNVRLVCLECHSNLPSSTTPVGAAASAKLGTVGPAIHDLNSPRFQQCTNCHQKVHGSNVNRDLFK